jgi:hypothetical protein
MKNEILLMDISVNLYPDTRYHFNVAQSSPVNFTLSIFPDTVTIIDGAQLTPIASYEYNDRNDIIKDLDHWLTIRGIFSLRAIISTLDQEQPPTLKATFEKGKTIPQELTEILECIKFQNREGASIYENNIYGMLGEKRHAEIARRMEFNDWLLNSMYQDCQVFIKPDQTKFKTGKGGNHIWIVENNERILMIHL